VRTICLEKKWKKRLSQNHGRQLDGQQSEKDTRMWRRKRVVPFESNRKTQREPDRAMFDMSFQKVLVSSEGSRLLRRTSCPQVCSDSAIISICDQISLSTLMFVYQLQASVTQATQLIVDIVQNMEHVCLWLRF
jgi:hypothetical protein